MTRLLISTPPRKGTKTTVLNLGVYPNPDVSSWSRQARWFGGYYDGVFTLYGEAIYDFFEQSLGYDVTEYDGNSAVWDGFIYEMVLHTQVDRIRSYDGVYNDVRAFAKNLLTNGGFETGDTTGWTENISGSGSISVITGNVAKGLYSVEMVAGTGGGRDTYVTQTVDAHAQTSYRLTFYYDDSDGPQVRYFIDCNVNTIIDVQPVDLSNNRWRRYSVDFSTPVGTTTVTVGLACPDTNGTTSHFDEIRLERLVDEKPANVVSPAKTNSESIANYGLRQRVMNSRFEYMLQAENTTQQFLDASAFPKTERGNVSGSVEHSLDVYVQGYMATFDWVFWALQTGGAIITLQQVFDRIVDENEFITGSIINGTPPGIALADSYTETQADILESCRAQVGSGYRIHVTTGGLLVCDVNDWEPRYYMRSGELYQTATLARAGRDPANIRTIQPAIVRDLDYPITGVEPESSYLDRRDFLMDRVELDQDGVSFST